MLNIRSPALHSDPRRAGLSLPSVLSGSGRGKFIKFCPCYRTRRFCLKIAILLKELPRDSAHASRYDHYRRVGLLDAVALPAVEASEITRAAHRHPGRFK